MNEQLPPGLQAAPRPPSRLRLLKKRSREPAVTNQDRVDAIAHAFVQTQQRAYPLVVGLFFGDQPPPDSLGQLARRHEEKRSPAKEAQAKQAMEVFNAVREGRLVPIED